MNLHHLQVFFAVAEEGSFTLGAESLAISQPAVSRMVADLENSVGEALFNRGQKGVTLTDAGSLLLGYARQIFTLEAEAKRALADLKGLETGHLTIGASTTIGERLLPTIIATFMRAHPRVELLMEVENTAMIQDGVLSGKYDVGFTEGKVDRKGLDAHVFAEDELVVFCCPSHALAHSKTATMEEISLHSFVMREVGSGTRLVVESICAEMGFIPKIACSLGSTTAIKSAVADGLGLGFASSLTLESEVSRGELVILKTPLNRNRKLHLLRVGWRHESAALRQFLRLLQKTVVAAPTK